MQRRLAVLKEQVEKYQIHTQRKSTSEDDNTEIEENSPKRAYGSEYNYGELEEIKKLPDFKMKKIQKFDKLFIKIVKFILHKLEISAPYIVQSLFDGEQSEYAYEAEDGYEHDYRSAQTDNHLKYRSGEFSNVVQNVLGGFGGGGIPAALFYYSTQEYVRLVLKEINFENLTSEFRELQRNVDQIILLKNQQNIIMEDLRMLTTDVKNLVSFLQLNGTYLYQQNAEKNVDKALLPYNADQFGMKDYALKANGGTIWDTPDTLPVEKHSLDIFKNVSIRKYSSPTAIIEQSGKYGQNYAFVGSHGKIQILLAKSIKISAVTMVHSKNCLLQEKEILCVPKLFNIYGYQKSPNDVRFLLGTFTYSLDGPAKQTFYIFEKMPNILFNYAEIEIMKNYGNKEFTCIYGFGVHGEP
ncbi:klaroid [Carabus blaptoides fortunei]